MQATRRMRERMRAVAPRPGADVRRQLPGSLFPPASSATSCAHHSVATIFVASTNFTARETMSWSAPVSQPPVAHRRNSFAQGWAPRRRGLTAGRVLPAGLGEKRQARKREVHGGASLADESLAGLRSYVRPAQRIHGDVTQEIPPGACPSRQDRSLLTATGKHDRRGLAGFLRSSREDSRPRRTAAGTTAAAAKQATEPCVP